MTTRTLAQLLAVADQAVRDRYGPARSDITRVAVEAAWKLLERPEGDHPEPMPDGIITCSTPEAAETLIAVRNRAELAADVIAVFKPRKAGGWNAYASDATMTRWQESLTGGTTTR